MSKLGLSIDPSVISRAKAYARRHGTSVSKMVEAYLDAVTSRTEATDEPPILRSLRGILKRSDAGDYRKHLIRKHKMRSPAMWTAGRVIWAVAENGSLRLLEIFAVAPVDVGTIQDALHSSSPDFEDAVTASAASRAKCDLVVTRDPQGFRGEAVRVLTPGAAAPLLVSA